MRYSGNDLKLEIRRQDMIYANLISLSGPCSLPNFVVLARD